MYTKRLLLIFFSVLMGVIASNDAQANETSTDKTQKRRQALMSEVTLPMTSAPQTSEPKFLKSRTENAVVVSGSTVKTLETGDLCGIGHVVTLAPRAKARRNATLRS